MLVVGLYVDSNALQLLVTIVFEVQPPLWPVSDSGEDVERLQDRLEEIFDRLIVHIRCLGGN